MAPAEARIFSEEHARIAAGPVLDLGIGAGRTTGFLAPLTPRYVGVDYSPAMVMHCRRRFEAPGREFILADAADLPMLESGSFPFILFSFNGIDSVAHDHRLRILAEIRRVLAKDGRFVFSAHNRAFAGIQRTPRFRRPLRARGMARTMVEIANHLRVRGQARVCADYELINDPPHLFSVLTYYIGLRTQIAQLEQAGLRVLSVIDADGRPAGVDDDQTISPDFHYVTELAR